MVGNKLIQTIQSMAKPPIGETTDLLFGEVTSVSPLKIRIDNRFEVDEQFLILSALVKETIVQVPTAETAMHSHIIPEHTTGSGGTGPHTHTIPEMTTYSALPSITLWRGLIVGDKVRLLRVANGQMFYVIEREEGVV
jgi:hypothetical protein